MTGWSVKRSPAAEDRPDSPGVKFPPPLVFLAGLAAGLAIDRLFPALPALPSPLRWVGLACLAVALGINLAGVVELRRAGTTVMPTRGATSLVSSGPFRFSRNPLYLSLTILQIGIALGARSTGMILMVVPAVLVIDRAVIPREERHLERVFGDAYRAYRARVRRWV